MRTKPGTAERVARKIETALNAHNSSTCKCRNVQSDTRNQKVRACRVFGTTEWTAKSRLELQVAACRRLLGGGS